MAFGRKKKEQELVIEEAEIIEQDEPEKEWPVINQPTTGGEPNMQDDVLDTTEDSRSSNGIHFEDKPARSRVLLTDHWVDEATAAAFEKVRVKLGAGTSLRTVTDYFFGHPARIHVNLPEPPPIESYSAKEIGAKVLPALTAALTDDL